ncbi:hypothetical protein CEXT_808451 [Caerostris extrusa]|uniref:Uncharacterized protein n=1 Tax=Caerostris extrusa TaxID=172846 RepID=A0AAV4SKB2_CAEEX|nr:hypothetical protein CEXT_808451 [Caerostris extrusa]
MVEVPHEIGTDSIELRIRPLDSVCVMIGHNINQSLNCWFEPINHFPSFVAVLLKSLSWVQSMAEVPREIGTHSIELRIRPLDCVCNDLTQK